MNNSQQIIDQLIFSIYLGTVRDMPGTLQTAFWTSKGSITRTSR
ncbi:hypothetical protein ACFQZJ_16740 [Maribacter chungangensis]|uniref:Uncharacterized protein n=1 Tax=Maribacter chungangensis TaxID=1069117 RepID=A0ABW3B9W6_9FLAO